MTDKQAIAEAYTDKLKEIYAALADAFLAGKNKAAAERAFLRDVKLAREARDVALTLLPP